MADNAARGAELLERFRKKKTSKPKKKKVRDGVGSEVHSMKATDRARTGSLHPAYTPDLRLRVHVYMKETATQVDIIQRPREER